MIQLKNYQSEALDVLVDLYVTCKPNKSILLSAPTGAGKTIIGGSLIDRISKIDQVAFIWISIGKSGLHEQSKYKINKFFPNLNAYSVSDIIQRNIQQLEAKEVLFMNWEAVASKSPKTGEWMNIFMQDTERMNLTRLVNNTKANNVPIVLIIDEAHSKGTSKRSREIIDIINPKVQFNITATPKNQLLKDCEGQFVQIPSEKVIKEGIIKEAIIVNKGIKNFENIVEGLLDVALRRHKQLKELYQKEGSRVNPLCLIQIPNGDEGKQIQDEIQRYLEKQNITQENERLAVWLTKDKINLEAIEAIDAPQEFLIFKQAIDTGWDCPRAQILVKFREVKSEIFSKQVIGRILRMPELHHYKHKDLNQAYIFTNEDTFAVDNIAELPEKVELPTETIPMKEEFKKQLSAYIIPTFPVVKDLSFIESKGMMTEVLMYLRRKLPIFLKDYMENNYSIKSKIPTNITFSLLNEHATKQVDKAVGYSIPMLRYIIQSELKTALGNLKDAEGVYGYILNEKEESIPLRTYLECIVYNIDYLTEYISTLREYFTVHPTIDLNELNLQYASIPSYQSVIGSSEGNPSFKKLIYEVFPYKVLSSKDKKIIDKLESDEEVKWWYYNRTFSYSVGFPVSNGKTISTYKPRFIYFKRNHIIVMDYTSSKANYEEIKGFLEFWKISNKMPVFDYKVLLMDTEINQIL